MRGQGSDSEVLFMTDVYAERQKIYLEEACVCAHLADRLEK